MYRSKRSENQRKESIENGNIVWYSLSHMLKSTCRVRSIPFKKENVVLLVVIAIIQNEKINQRLLFTKAIKATHFSTYMRSWSKNILILFRHGNNIM
jgi:hypothetical protein